MTSEPLPGVTTAFVPTSFEPPALLEVALPEGAAVSGGRLRLEPLGPEHNERDFHAWTSSVDHIRASPGFAEHRWPHEMTLAENERDLIGHADDFTARRGFTYTVLDGGDDVVGCVYIYPDDAGHDAHVRSWVRADHPALDPVLRTAVANWLSRDWPFGSVRYAGLPSPT